MSAGADVIVVGLGAHGAATLLQLARRGVTATGIDMFVPPHDRGSSHGDTRITRLAIGEGAQYTPLVQRSHAIWRAIEHETGAELLTQNGCLVIQDGGDTSVHASRDFLGVTVAAAREHAIALEELDAAEMASRFPQFHLSGDERGCFEPSGGFVRPERCIAVQLDLARRHGATVITGERVLRVDPERDHVRVVTTTTTRSAAQVVVAAGAWIAQLVPDVMRDIARVFPQTLAWFAATGASDVTPDAMPSFIWALRDGGVLYGIPAIDAEVAAKVGAEQYVTQCDPDVSDAMRVAPADVAALTALLRDRVRALTTTPVRAIRCLYTTTPDMGFIIDRHPLHERVVLISACSGHGFKHSAGIGEAVAEHVTEGRSRVDLSAFSLGRHSAA